MSALIRTAILGFVACVPGCRSLPMPSGGVEVEFPVSAATKPDEGRPEHTPAEWDHAEDVYIEGMLAYRVAFQPGVPLAAERFDQIQEGMTLRGIIELLGPGYKNVLQGVNAIYWHCEDGRSLHLQTQGEPISGKPDYRIHATGENQRHDEVGELARTLFLGLRITDGRAWIALKEDTSRVKGGKARFYGIGDCVQIADPLPRIDFCIKAIGTNFVYCDYFYQAAPEGIVCYSERGSIILKARPQGSRDID